MREAIVLLVVAACASSGGDKEPAPSPDAAIETVKCGDGVCAATEIGACTADCGAAPMAVCGNGMCEMGESQQACPADCSMMGVCGDGTCNGPAETDANCPGDCATTSGAVCGNAVCETGEDATTCPLDCGGASTCPGGDDVGCFFCWFDPTTCIPPQTEQLCAQCLGL